MSAIMFFPTPTVLVVVKLCVVLTNQLTRQTATHAAHVSLHVSLGSRFLLPVGVLRRFVLEFG